jgi:predicted branched-subunit amino acid permease
MDADTLPAAAPGAALPGPSAARQGVLVMLPLLAGYVPFALVIGSVAADRGAPVAGWAGSWLIYGGSAHLAALQTLQQSGPAAAVLTGLLVHARLVVYSAALARRWPDQPRWFRLAAAGLIIDPTWAVAERHADTEANPAAQRRHFVAAGLTLGVGWSAAVAAGVLLGARLDGRHLQVVVPLCLLGLVGPGLRAAGSRAVVVVAAAAAALTADWPNGSGLLVAVAAGCAAGSLGSLGSVASPGPVGSGRGRRTPSRRGPQVRRPAPGPEREVPS